MKANLSYSNDLARFSRQLHCEILVVDAHFASFYLPDTLKKYQFTVKEEMEEEYPLRAALEASKKSVIQGSMDALMVKINSWIDHCSLVQFPLCKVYYMNWFDSLPSVCLLKEGSVESCEIYFTHVKLVHPF